MTQKQIAKILHCSQQVYSDYELGTRNLPVDILIRLAQYHKTTTDYLLGLTDRRERL